MRRAGPPLWWQQAGADGGPSSDDEAVSPPQDAPLGVAGSRSWPMTAGIAPVAVGG